MELCDWNSLAAHHRSSCLQFFCVMSQQLLQINSNIIPILDYVMEISFEPEPTDLKHGNPL